MAVEPMTELSPGPRVSVVVPVKNEALNILPLVEEIERACAPLGPFEVIYVDDGSTDATVEQVLKRPGDAAVAAPRPARGELRPERGGAHRRPCRARPHRRDPRRRRAERSGLHPAAGGGPRRPGGRAGGRAAGRPQGRRLQEVAVAHRQRRARADPEGRDAGYGLRPEGVPPRRLSARCPISTPCTASCRPWSSARGIGSPMWTWSIGRAMPGGPITACSTGFGSASSTSPASGG